MTAGKTLHLLSFFLIVGVMIGCTSTTRPDLMVDPPGAEGLRRLAREARQDSSTWNISHQRIDGRPWLGLNSEIRLRLAQLEAHFDDPASFRNEAAQVLERMLDVGEEFLRIDAAGIAPKTLDRSVLERAGELEQEAVARLTTPSDCRAWLDEVRENVPELDKRKGRLLRMMSALPAVPFVNAWISHHAKTEWRGKNWRDFPRAVVYEPRRERDAEILRHLETATNEQLLALYAPAIVQEIPEENLPDFRDDIPGRVGLIPDRKGNPVAEIDESRPTVYGHVTRAFLNGRWLRQVNYSFWYHDHPELKPNDPEAGRAEGQLIRITLDEENRPLLSEAVYACGCYHRIYPLDAIELEAEGEYGEPAQGEHSIARKVHGRIDPVVPETGGTFSFSNPHPIVSVRSGFHLVAALRFEASPPAFEQRTSYDLLSSRDLELLRWGGETVSLYGRDGLVRGADRPEAWMLYPSGMYHAGTPRAPGLHLVHFDQYDYDDPELLETMLRIPRKAGAPNDVAASPNPGRAAADRLRDGL